MQTQGKLMQIKAIESEQKCKKAK